MGSAAWWMVGVARRFGVAVAASVVAALALAPMSYALPEGRVYEQVSPEVKDGYPVFSNGGGTFGAALDGESVFFSSVGAFKGSGEDYALNPYVATRTGSGWVTTGLFPSPSLTGGELLAGLEEMSPELTSFEYVGNPVETASERLEAPTNRIWRREADGSFVPYPAMTDQNGEPDTIEAVGAASDLSRFVLSQKDLPSEHIKSPPGPVVDETQLGTQLFEAEEGSLLRLVAVDDSGKQLTRYCPVLLGGLAGGVGSVSQPDASSVFFSVPIDSFSSEGGGCKGNPADPVELFVRIDGSKTLRVSEPSALECSEEPCAKEATETPKEAVFQGASEDGSRVYFTTTQSLVNGDKDHSNDLYMAEIGTNGSSGEPEVTSLTQVSHDPNAGQAAEVQPHVVAVSTDGSHVYFVAKGVLAADANAEGEAAIDGAENLYVYDAQSPPGTAVSFVADLCSGAELSGTATDQRCPGSSDENLWKLGSDFEFQEAQTTENGDFLAFATYAQLIDQGPEADTDTARDIYRYDAVTGSIERVSLGEDGLDENGNNSLFSASITPSLFRGSVQEQYELGRRAISADGSTIVLTTSEPISDDAINGVQDVYEWHEGSVSLISSGAATEADEDPVIDPSGNDIFFITSAGLVPGDTDGLRDVYDARRGGGFPAPPAPPEECSADGCQGALSTPAPLLVPGSVSQPAGGNLPAPRVKAKPKPKKKAKAGRKAVRSKAGKRRTRARSGRRSSGRGARKSTRGGGR